MPNNISVGSSGAVMGLFGAKLAEVFCRACESDKTQQGRVGHLGRYCAYLFDHSISMAAEGCSKTTMVVNAMV